MANVDRMTNGDGKSGALNLAGQSVEKMLSMSPEERAKGLQGGGRGLQSGPDVRRSHGGGQSYPHERR